MKENLGLTKTIKSLAKILMGKPNIPASLADNQLLQVLLNRRSVRSFSSQPIPGDVFNAILEAGRLAPSTVNLQSWAFAVYDADSWKETFGRAIPFLGRHAVVIICDFQRYRKVLDEIPYAPLTEYTAAVMNASMAAMNMNIAAEALGVSSVMLSETGRSGILDAKYLKEKLDLPEGTVPLMTMVFGYARGAYPPMPPKLPLEQVVLNGKFEHADPSIMEDWLDQMTAGYKASHPGSSFKAQVEKYQDRISQAEKDLREMIFYRGEPD